MSPHLRRLDSAFVSRGSSLLSLLIMRQFTASLRWCQFTQDVFTRGYLIQGHPCQQVRVMDVIDLHR